MTPKISIIIPVYNTERYIRKCLDSIKEQDYTNFEVILVNDCSTDKSVEIIEEYIKEDYRFKLYHNDVNMGCGLTRRKAISLGTGDYFAFIDSDDYMSPNFLSIMLDACLRTNSEISICGTYNREEDYEYTSQDLCEKEYIVSKDQLYKEYMLSSWIRQYNGNKLYAKRVIDAIEYSGLRYCEDSITTYKWLWEANQAVVLPISMYHYIHHEDSNSNKNNEPLIKSYDTCVCVYDHWKFCIEHGFTYMLERLKIFIRPYIRHCMLQLDDKDERIKVIYEIRDSMFGD